MAGLSRICLAIASNGAGDGIVFLRTGTAFDPAPRLWRHATGELVRIADDFSHLAGAA